MLINISRQNSSFELFLLHPENLTANVEMYHCLFILWVIPFGTFVKHDRVVFEFLEGFDRYLLTCQQCLLLLIGQFCSLNRLVSSLGIFICHLFHRVFLFLFLKFLTLLGTNLYSGQPFIHLISRWGIEQHSIFRYPSPSLIEFGTLLRQSNPNDISVVEVPVIVVHIFPIGHHKTTGTQRYSWITDCLFFCLYFFLWVDVGKTDHYFTS